ncbi:MAG TPA: sigma-70 family RNA polymerase sigma factor [Planctomycetota bacterium]|jgi:RNA polymerase sigma-70 factor (ECF subfamily)|nr:sigma-70 family RNA polymerase sigma factor [Planctomycetota bacterium]
MNAAAPLVPFRSPGRSIPTPAPEAPTDHDLIRGIQGGDPDAFRALFERHQRRAYGIAYQMVGNAEEASDVVQEAFLRIHRSIDRFDFSKAFTTWLYRIVVNLSIDGLRRSGLRRDVGIEDLEDSIPAGARPEALLESDETVRLVRSVLEELPPKFKAVMVLRDLHGLSGKEIASIVGASHATVRWRLHRARKAFRVAWERKRDRRGPGRGE